MHQQKHGFPIPTVHRKNKVTNQIQICNDTYWHHKIPEEPLRVILQLEMVANR